MVNRTLSIWNELRPFQVGFDHAFERFNTQLEHTQGSNFPPYNIKKLDSFNWTIEMALAGFGKNDIEVEVTESTLSVRSVKEDDSDHDSNQIYRGIAYRKFERKFTLADAVVVNGAKLENGMLLIDLERVVPEEKKPRLISVK